VLCGGYFTIQKNRIQFNFGVLYFSAAPITAPTTALQQQHHIFYITTIININIIINNINIIINYNNNNNTKDLARTIKTLQREKKFTPVSAFLYLIANDVLKLQLLLRIIRSKRTSADLR
jgi:hypothetical protein